MEQVVADAVGDHPPPPLAVEPLGHHDSAVHRELALHLHRPRPHRQPEARDDRVCADAAAQPQPALHLRPPSLRPVHGSARLRRRRSPFTKRM